ncbi:Kdo domain containing protein [Flavobacterium sp. L1I52]|uniref:Kdo domain containing protein n=1 Tax=Flavobacterium pokkalii TaxID=1940408 RepID=A0ABR7UX16_9FLAO|nr:lipopolysaccharide kinase InaA family protein [Flavobacterium pokkalii]MBD0726603.1 Kdo domain containing protein [Flavobacterium pokkalii]
MIVKINSHFQKFAPNLKQMVEKFKTSGQLFGDGKRNTIKLFELEDIKVNIKSFKVPHLINSVVYKYFRKSKARRSYEYAVRLLENGIGTPQPIAYFENANWLGLKDSYYVSEHLDADLTYRELIHQPDYPDHENILRQFTRFTFNLHEKGIEFLDHSPGNTLINKGENGQYQFYLVDLNRMNFHTSMGFEQRMKNFSHLAAKKEMIVIMSEEYAKYYSKYSANQIFEEILKKNIAFQNKYSRKKRIKNKIKFWKKKN